MIQNAARYVLPIAIMSLVFAGAAFADSYSNPDGSPPGHNTYQPIDVSSVDQTTSGDFWANAIGAATYFKLGSSNNSKWFKDTDNRVTVTAQKYCIGNNCITAWPGSSGSLSCSLDRTTKIIDTNGQPYHDACQAQAPDGYVATGSDSCTASGSDNCDNGGRDAKCYYIRATCNGSVVDTTLTSSTFDGASCDGTKFLKGPVWNPGCAPVCDECGVQIPAGCVFAPGCSGGGGGTS